MLADPTFADMVQAIGEASLGADEKTIWHLTKVCVWRAGAMGEPAADLQVAAAATTSHALQHFFFINNCQVHTP